MNKREAAIVTAYTGIFIGEFSEFHSYVEELLDRPVFTHELPDLEERIKELAREDFIKLSKSIEN